MIPVQTVTGLSRTRSPRRVAGTSGAAAPRSLQRALAGLAAVCLAATLQARDTDWSETGRPLPRPEAVQPDLDPDLQAYVRCPVASDAPLTGTAPAILPDLVKRWAAAFTQRSPAIRLEVPPPYGPPQGALNPRLQAFLQGSGDFAFLTRAMSLADRATFLAAHGHAPRIIPVALGSYRHFGFVDPVVLVVNDANPVGQLSNADLRRLFAAPVARSERPASWSDVGVEDWKDRPITIVGGATWHRQDSARALVVRERLLANGSLRTDLGVASGSEAEVPDRVAADPDAVGFTGLGHLRPGIHPLAIEDDTGEYIAPTYDNVAGARYPLTRTVDLVLATPPGLPLRAAMAEFLRFVLSRDGQSIVLEQGIFLPLRASQVRAALHAVGLSEFACPGARATPAAARHGHVLPIR